MSTPCARCGTAIPTDGRFCPGCGTPIAPITKDDMVGRVIADRYVLIEQIGSGSAGTIYRGEHRTLRKRVAVKILHQKLSSDERAIERFRREATTVSEIDNDHILEVSDFGRTEDGRLFIAMELLDGEPLANVLARDGKLPIPRAIDILSQVADVLAEAHALGYVHRDLRPRNLFLTTRRGRTDFIKLLDFGLSKLVLDESQPGKTLLGMNLGDARYLAPEQIGGGPVEQRADLFALGVIGYEMLTGTVPFSPSVSSSSTIPSVRALRPDCPEWLDLVIRRALGIKLEERFVTAKKMLDCLVDTKAPEPLAAQPAPTRGTLMMPTMVPTPSPTPVPAEDPTQVDRQRSSSDIPAISGEWEAPPSTNPRVEVGPSIVVEPVTTERAIPEHTLRVKAPVEDWQEETPPPSRAIMATSRRRRDESGEWFEESDGGQRKREPLPYDEEDAAARNKRRSQIIIFGVTGGMLLLMAIFIFVVRLGAPPPKPVVTALPSPSPTPPPSPEPPSPPPSPIAVAPSPPPAEPTPMPSPSESPSPRPSPVAVTPHPKPAPVEKPAPAPAEFRDPFAGKPQPKDTVKQAIQSDSFVRIAKQKLASGDLSAAAVNFDKARELDGKNAEAIAGLGEVAFEHGDYQGAAVHLRQAVRLSPSQSRFMVLLGQSYYKQNKFKEAATEYRRALRVDPGNSEAQRSLEVAEKKLATP